jgi:hypothetical protein
MPYFVRITYNFQNFLFMVLFLIFSLGVDIGAF